MFYLKTLVKNVSVRPSNLGRSVVDTVKDSLKAIVEGTFNEEDGYIIAVISYNDDVGHGRINPDTGNIEFRVTYQAIILKPEDNDVVDVRILKTDEACIKCSMGPIVPIVLHKAMMQEGMVYNATTHTWSQSEDYDQEFKDGGKVRLKLTKMDWRMPLGIATVKQSGLGQLPEGL